MAKEKLAQRLWDAEKGFVNPEDGMSIDPEIFQQNYLVVGRVQTQDGPRDLSEEEIAQRATRLGGVFYANSHKGHEVLVYRAIADGPTIRSDEIADEALKCLEELRRQPNQASN